MDSASKTLVKANLEVLSKGKEFEDLEKNEIDRMVQTCEEYMRGAEMPTHFDAQPQAKRMRPMAAIKGGKTKKDVKKQLEWMLLKAIFGSAVAKTEEQWKVCKTIKVTKLKDLQKTLDELKLGMGGVMLYHDESYGISAISYVISGVTNSRFSHATMILPMQADHKDIPILLQSNISGEPVGVGAGVNTKPGPDIANLRKLLKNYALGWPSRFVFRPLKVALTDDQQAKALASAKAVIALDTKFPTEEIMGWQWVLANHPKLLKVAQFLGIDCDVADQKYKTMFCSQLVTNTLKAAGIIDADTNTASYSPGDYGLLPVNGVMPEKHLFEDVEYEFVFDKADLDLDIDYDQP